MQTRLGSDPTLLWLWCRLAATAPIRPLAWEPPYVVGETKKKKKKKKKKKNYLMGWLQRLNKIIPIISHMLPAFWLI